LQTPSSTDQEEAAAFLNDEAKQKQSEGKLPRNASLPSLDQLGLLGLQLPKRRLGTLSLSSWSVSCDGAHNNVAASDGASAVSSRKKKKVETRTVGVQVEPQPQMLKLPAPLSASSVPRDGQVKALQKQRLKKVQKKTAVVEGKAHLKQFTSTPRFTRSSSLRELVSCFNVDGKGCCSRHIAWMGVQECVTEELLRPCAPVLLYKDWQCPECNALNNFDIFPDMEEDEDTPTNSGEGKMQLCILCHDFVSPRLPQPPPPEQLQGSSSTPDTADLIAPDLASSGKDAWSDSNTASSGDSDAAALSS